MQPPLRTNRQFIAIYSAAITANAPSRVFNTVLHETRNTGPEGGRGKGEGKNLLETVRVRPLLVVHRFSLICLQSAKRAVSFLFPLNSLHRFIHIYIHVALCFYVYSSLSSLIIFRLLLLLRCYCSTSNRREREFSLPVLTPLSYFLASFSLMGRGRARSSRSHITDGERTVFGVVKGRKSSSITVFRFRRVERDTLGNGVKRREILREKERRKVRAATWECARLVKEERASVTAHAALLTTPGVVPPRRKAEPRW